MTDILVTRRRFLAGAGMLLASALLPRRTPAAPPPPVLPTLYSDGVHDDGPALAALANGHDVWDAKFGIVQGRKGFVLVDRTLYVAPGFSWPRSTTYGTPAGVITRCTFRGSPLTDGQRFRNTLVNAPNPLALL